MSSTIILHPVKKIITMVCFVTMACRIIGMMSVGDRAHVFGDG
jgi:hypothetical protein